MKKQICVSGVLLVLMAAVLTGCNGENQDTEEPQETGLAQEDIAFLKELEEVNAIDSMAERNGRVFYTITEITADGTEDSYTVYEDEARYVLTDDYGILIEENGDVYGMDTEQGIPYHSLFIGDAYEDFVTDYKQKLVYAYDTEERITSKEVKDGMIYLETELPIELAGGYYEAYGYTSDNVDYILSEYEIDSETKEIFRLKTYMVSGEKKALYSEVVLEKECEEYVPDQELRDGVFGGEARTVSVITDAGTAEEKTYTQTVTKGGEISFYIPEEFEETLYADAACTEAVEADRTSDQTVYLKRIE